MNKLLIILLFPIALFSQQAEILPWNQGSISDKILLTVSREEFEKKYRADSITTPTVNETCGTEAEADARTLHYKGVSFELNKGILNFRKIDFRKRRNMWLAFKDDWFDHTTTLKNFSKTYPDAAAFVEEYESENGEIFEMLTLLPSEKENDFEWQFFFREGKLQYVECFLYCR